MKIFRCSQVKTIDAYTIKYEPISSINLMERAATKLLHRVVSRYSYAKRFVIFAGPGNNGGDGVALARMLAQIGYDVKLLILKASHYSPDTQENIERIKKQGIVVPSYLTDESDFPVIDSDSIVIDALFGSGLTRPLGGLVALLVKRINSSKVKVISVDIPSGLFGEDNPVPNTNPVIEATCTLTLQFPKLNFFFPENEQYVGKWDIVDIGLHKHIVGELYTPFSLTDVCRVKELYRSRRVFSHKGTFGHTLIIAGSNGMFGAAALCVNACLRAGAGLVTAHTPRAGYSIIQSLAPEALVQIDSHDHFFTDTPDLSKYSSVAFGPGVGQNVATVEAFKVLLTAIKIPLVVDADGLNILSQNKKMLQLLPNGTVLTPHVGEFNRLFGHTSSGSERLKLAIKMATKYKVVIVIKGAFSQVVTPKGEVYVNSSGNPGLATGGSGDVLTGIITGLLAQDYSSEHACAMGVYIHGLAADIAANKLGQTSLVATDLVSNVGQAFLQLNS